MLKLAKNQFQTIVNQGRKYYAEYLKDISEKARQKSEASKAVESSPEREKPVPPDLEAEKKSES